jgi:hypothetical protein
VPLTSSRTLCWLVISFAFAESVGADNSDAFKPVYQILKAHCGACHRQGGASSWTIDAPASSERYAQCLIHDDQQAIERCTTWHQLVDAPGPEIPAWVIAGQPGDSAPYVQACDPEQSYHLGVSLPKLLSPETCRIFAAWINQGAPE